MSNALIAIVGIAIFIALAAAGAFFLQPALSNTAGTSESTRIIAEGAQVNFATNMYLNDNGSLPSSASTGTGLIDLLVLQNYLKVAPSGANSQWTLNSQSGSVLSSIGTGAGSRNICVAMRKAANMPDPTNILACDGTGGALDDRDPCCTQ